MPIQITKPQVLSSGFFWLSISVSFFLFNPPTQSQDIQLQVGIVQRLGEKDNNQLTISATSGNSLTLNFIGNDGKPTIKKLPKITLEVLDQSLPKPIVEERLVLSDHATFETAEDDAVNWQKKGIVVEVTQPERWQVWASRDVYQTPLLRRWLLNSLKDQGYKNPYLETNIVTKKLSVSFLIDGYRYYRNNLDISSSDQLFIVQGKDPKNQPSTNTFAGSLKIQPNAYGTFTLVNLVDLETYLRGVVPYEIAPEAPEKAIEAQAIIARTYVLRNLRRFAADNYQICATTHCQVYFGLTGVRKITDKAIAATEGLVLTYKNELVDALYSSTTGGVTATFSDVWNGANRPYLTAVIDSPNQLWNLGQNSLAQEENFKKFINLKDGFNETGRSVFRWNKQNTLAEIKADLQRYLEKRKHPLANFNTIQSMTVVKRSPSGRILQLDVKTDKGTIELYKNEVRSAFGPPRSTLFYLEPVYDSSGKLVAYAFVGGGFGHGVGLSQYGSYNLAKLGWSADKILEFYYPGTTITPLNQSLVFWREP